MTATRELKRQGRGLQLGTCQYWKGESASGSANSVTGVAGRRKVKGDYGRIKRKGDRKRTKRKTRDERRTRAVGGGYETSRKKNKRRYA